MTDIYDEEIARITREVNAGDTSAIKRAWGRESPLFAFVGPSGTTYHRHGCGCLTQIREGIASAFARPGVVDVELTIAIRADERIPVNYWEITLEDLPVFAEWQRYAKRLREEAAAT